VVKRLFTGLEALARGAHERGVHVVAVHPLRLLDALAIACEAMGGARCERVDTPRIAVEVAMGAALAGGRAIAAAASLGSALDLVEAAAHAGVAGLVLVAVDDVGGALGPIESDSRLIARAAKVPCLEPADPRECKGFVGEALALSERYETPVLVRLTARLALTAQAVALGPAEVSAARGRPATPRALSAARPPSLSAALDERLAQLCAAAAESTLNRADARSVELGLIASGPAARHAREAFPEASLLTLGLSWPVPTALVRAFAGSVRRLVVAEELEPLLEGELRAARIACGGKDLLPRHGELTPDVLRRALDRAAPRPEAAHAPDRPAEACPGCPHRAVAHALKRLHVTPTADLGCAAFAAEAPARAVELALGRGAAVGVAHGIEAALGARARGRVVALVADAPLAYAASLAHAARAGASAAVVVVRPDADEARALASAAGARCEEVDAFDVAAVERAVAAALASPGASVVAARGGCPLEGGPRGAPRRVEPSRCNRCGACLRLGCPSISDALDAMAIDAALCAGCGVCAQVCRAGAIAAQEAAP
jgi:indolepyruvate ferredoxin oxidoreductase alpha subunit